MSSDDVVHQCRVDPRRGFVKQDQVGFEHQHSREFEQFLLAATELVGAVLPYLLKV